MEEQQLAHKMSDLVKKLRNEGKEVLAKKIEETWNQQILGYSRSLFTYQPKQGMEPELLHAFQEELAETGYGSETINRVLAELQKYRTLQTSAHTEIVPPSRRFCIDWMSTQGLEYERPYIIGAFSGVPFSNKSKPGRIHLHGSEINFIPKTHQDALVYETKILEKTEDTYASLPAELSWMFNRPNKEQYFSQWAAHSESRLLSRVLEHETIVIDINRVITRYIISVLPNENHIMHQLLLNPAVTNKVLDLFGSSLHFFYTPYESAKYAKQENLYYLDGYGFAGDHEQYPHDLDKLLVGLREDKLCPGTLLVFTALSFLNEFQCLGSFVQVEYLTRFKKLWQESGLLKNNIQNIPTESLTTCMFPSEPDFQALNILTEQKNIPGEKTDKLGEYYLPIWERNLYYTNKQT